MALGWDTDDFFCWKVWGDLVPRSPEKATAPLRSSLFDRHVWGTTSTAVFQRCIRHRWPQQYQVQWFASWFGFWTNGWLDLKPVNSRGTRRGKVCQVSDPGNCQGDEADFGSPQKYFHVGQTLLPICYLCMCMCKYMYIYTYIYDMIWHDITWHYITLHDIILHDVILYMCMRMYTHMYIYIYIRMNIIIYNIYIYMLLLYICIFISM